MLEYARCALLFSMVHLSCGCWVRAHARGAQTAVDWQLETEAQAHAMGACVGRVSRWPRGKCLGGSSSINYMAYVRGDRADYDAWAHELGCDGWDYDSVLPYFLKSEGTRLRAAPEHPVDGAVHGADGPLATSFHT